MEKKLKDNKLVIHNKISDNFRQLHVDGAYGGLTPKGLLNVNFYAERFPIPKSITHDLAEKTLLKSEDSKIGLIREFEFGIYMDLKVAKQISDFLLNKIAEYEQITKSEENASPNSK